MGEIRILEVIGDGLVRVHVWNIGTQIWIRTSKRGVGKHCVYCGKDLTGSNSYRPTGNQKNRGMRLCIDHVKSGITLPIIELKPGEEYTEREIKEEPQETQPPIA
jgi:hypothetical protein